MDRGFTCQFNITVGEKLLKVTINTKKNLHHQAFESQPIYKKSLMKNINLEVYPNIFLQK